MTGPDPTDPETDHADLRALLADLGSAGSHPPGPVPDDVAARLDATLADLTDRSAPVSPSTPARPGAPEHRRWPRLLVAAAVVLVLGAGGVTTARLVTTGSGNEAASSESSGSGSADAGGGTAEELPEDSLRAPDDLPLVRRTTLAADAAVALLDARTATTTESALGTCARPPGRGEQVAVSLDGEPAVLVGRPARDGRRVVEAWACDASRVLARTRVPAPTR